jgi:hypothetical protein
LDGAIGGQQKQRLMLRRVMMLSVTAKSCNRLTLRQLVLQQLLLRVVFVLRMQRQSIQPSFLCCTSTMTLQSSTTLTSCFLFERSIRSLSLSLTLAAHCHRHCVSLRLVRRAVSFRI